MANLKETVLRALKNRKNTDIAMDYLSKLRENH